MISQDKIKDSLIRLGYNLSDRGSYWQTNAIFRNGDNKTAIQIYKNTGVWKDHVQNNQFSPFKRLVEITLGTNDPKILKEYTSEEHTGDQYERLISNPQKIEMEEIYKEEDLRKLLPHYKFYTDKGINEDILKKLKGGFATNGKLNKRFVFPIYNEYKQIHGFSGRDMSNMARERPKWKHVGRKSNWVYPLYSNDDCRQSIESSKEVIIVESIGDMLNLNQNGYSNVLVSFGLDFSSKLICSTLSLNCKKIIISLNNDSQSKENRGLHASIKNYLKLLNYYESSHLCICLPNKKDFGDMNTEDFNQWKKKMTELDIDYQKSYIDNYLNTNRSKFPKSLIKNMKTK